MKDGARTTSELVDCPAAEILHRQKTSDMIGNVAEPKTLCHPDWDRGGLSACAASRSASLSAISVRETGKEILSHLAYECYESTTTALKTRECCLLPIVNSVLGLVRPDVGTLVYVLLHGTHAERKEVVPRQRAEG